MSRRHESNTGKQRESIKKQITETAFSFLKNIKRNEMIYLQTMDKTVVYKVYDFQIINSTDFMLPIYSDNPALVLATCYPFDTITYGGPLRYLVFAAQLSDTDVI